MRTHDYNLGGEQSGHIILNDYITTGDALIAALQVLAVVVERNRPVSEVCRVFEPVPQLLRNVRYNGGRPLDDAAVIEAIRDGEICLGNEIGRAHVRTPVTNAHLVCRLLLEQTTNNVHRPNIVLDTHNKTE